jgi:hypothetical protein
MSVLIIPAQKKTPEKSESLQEEDPPISSALEAISPAPSSEERLRLYNTGAPLAATNSSQHPDLLYAQPVSNLAKQVLVPATKNMAEITQPKQEIAALPPTPLLRGVEFAPPSAPLLRGVEFAPPSFPVLRGVDVAPAEVPSLNSLAQLEPTAIRSPYIQQVNRLLNNLSTNLTKLSTEKRASNKEKDDLRETLKYLEHFINADATLVFSILEHPAFQQAQKKFDVLCSDDNQCFKKTFGFSSGTKSELTSFFANLTKTEQEYSGKTPEEALTSSQKQLENHLVRLKGFCAQGDAWGRDEEARLIRSLINTVLPHVGRVSSVECLKIHLDQLQHLKSQPKDPATPYYYYAILAANQLYSACLNRAREILHNKHDLSCKSGDPQAAQLTFNQLKHSKMFTEAEMSRLQRMIPL